MLKKEYIIAVIDGCTVVGKIVKKISDATYTISKPRIIIQQLVGVLENGEFTAPDDPNRKGQRINLKALPFVYAECLDKGDNDEWIFNCQSLYRIVDDSSSIIKFYEAESALRSNVVKEGLVEKNA